MMYLYAFEASWSLFAYYINGKKGWLKGWRNTWKE